jgi:sec-independent protein translocase protein TatA
MPHIGMQELLIILVVVLVLFGGKKLPELAKGLGQGMREFKKATRETAAEDDAAPVSATTEPRP